MDITLKKFKVWLVSGGYVEQYAPNKYELRELIGENFKLVLSI